MTVRTNAAAVAADEVLKAQADALRKSAERLLDVAEELDELRPGRRVAADPPARRGKGRKRRRRANA